MSDDSNLGDDDLLVPVEPDEHTTSPYEGLELQDGVGFHDPDASVLDTLSAKFVEERPSASFGAARATAARTGSAARSWALAQTHFPVAMCLVFARECFAVPALYGSARLGWLMARSKHRQSSGAGIPANVPIWWSGGSHGFGHVAFSLGGGLCRSTDWPHSGMVSTTRIDDITRYWHLNFEGWSEDINAVRVYTPLSGGGGGGFDPHMIDLSNVQAAVRARGKITNGIVLKKAVAAEVGRGVMNLASPILGSGFRSQYSLVQRKYLTSVGITHPPAADVDGVPGLASLKWLAGRHGLRVK